MRLIFPIIALLLAGCVTTGKPSPKSVKDVNVGDVLTFGQTELKKAFSDCSMEVTDIATTQPDEYGPVPVNPSLCGYLTCTRGSMTKGMTTAIPICLPIQLFIVSDVKAGAGGFSELRN